MADSARRPAVPRGMGDRGAAFWRDVVRSYSLRVDELRLLEDACRELDLISLMDATLRKAPLMQSGRYRGMESVHPLLIEVRQHRALFAKLAKQLGLPDDVEPGAVAGAVDGGRPRSVQARAAATARWQRRP